MPEYVKVRWDEWDAMQRLVDKRSRDAWTVQVPAGELVRRCEARRGYHARRVEDWMHAAHELAEKVRGSGIELREQSTTGGPRFAAVVDHELGGEYATAQAKLKEHRSYRDVYRRWESFFAACEPSGMFSLTVGDLSFFAALPEGVDDDE